MHVDYGYSEVETKERLRTRYENSALEIVGDGGEEDGNEAMRTMRYNA